MIAAEAPFTAPSAPNVAPPVPHLSFHGVDAARLPFQEVDEILDRTFEVSAHIWQTGNEHGSLGLQTDERRVAAFRTGQVVHLTAGNDAATAQSYYIAYDHTLRPHDPANPVQPIEVTAFRGGLQEQYFGQREQQTRPSTVDHADAIGMTVLNDTIAEIAKPTRFARWRKLGGAVMTAVSAAGNFVQELRGASGGKHHTNRNLNQVRATAPRSTGPHTARHRKRPMVHLTTVTA